MESLTYETLVPRFVKTVPEVPLNTEDVAGNRAYLVFNDLMRFVDSKIEARESAEVLMRIFGFIEAGRKRKMS